MIDYTTASVLGDDTYDVVVDLVGNLTLRELRSLLRPHGALVLSGGGVSGKGRTVGPMKLLIWAQLYARFSGLRLFVPQAAPNTEVLEQLAALIAAGKVTPVIDPSLRPRTRSGRHRLPRERTCPGKGSSSPSRTPERHQ